MVATDHGDRLMRYVTYDAGSELNGNAGGIAGKAEETVPSGPALTSATLGHHEATATASPKSNRDVARAPDAMADMHLSGSDPRMFPGILTRDHRSGSLRNLAQAAEWPVDSNEAPSSEDDV